MAAEGREILVARAAGSYYAVDNKCPHFGGDLAAGKLEGTVITCPRHGSQFDLKDGKNRRWLKGSGLLSAIGKVVKSPRDIASYKVEITGEDIYVEFP